MTLFEQLKNIPKVDMHINLTSSISTDLAYSLMNEENILNVIDKMQEKNVKDYENALKLPIKILKNKQNVTLAINDLIDRLIKNNVIYGELFIDLPLYSKHILEEELLQTILKTINERKYHLQVVLVISSQKEKEDNLKTLDLFMKYYGKGVNGIYFMKDKMTNLSSYNYIFDRLIKNSYPYIINLDSKITSQDNEIYLNAKRIIYSLPTINETFYSIVRQKDIILELSPTRFRENNVFDDLKNYFLYDLMKENVNITITSQDMTTLNTDVLNEWCLIFNNYPLVLHDLIKVMNNNLVKANMDNKIKDKLIEELREKSNLVF